MNKIMSLILSFGVVFNTSGVVFADKGNPLDEHPENYQIIRKKFEEIEMNSGNPLKGFKWEKKPNFWFWDDDYRTVRVYNIPHLINATNDDNFFRKIVILLIDARNICSSSEKIGKAVGKEALKLLNSELKKQKKGSAETLALADFLGTDENMAIDSFVAAFGMACISKICHGIAVGGSWLGIFVPLAPAVGAAVAIIDIASFFTTRSALANERVKNCAMVLNAVYRIITENPNRILNSNVLVTAIDERNFTALLRWNAFRRDDGAWCDFEYIGGLKCAPRGREYLDDRGHNLIEVCSRICNEIMNNGKLDMEKMKAFTEKKGFLSCVIVTDPSKKEEKKESHLKIEEIV